MKNILVVTASIQGPHGHSSVLAEQALERLRDVYGELQIRRRELSAEPVPHLDARRFAAFTTAPEDRDAEQKAVVNYSDILIEEIREADILVFGVPMYNFGIPSTLKAYFDHIARAGVTFRYTDQGPVGLLRDRPVYILAARGGLYAGTDNDTQTPYLRAFLGFLGLKDLHFIYAEGLNMGEAQKEEALSRAQQELTHVIA